jgi:hypothetical protein
MTLRSKLVAAMLAVTLFGLPEAAAVTCWFHRPASAIRATHCQMMSKHRGLVSIQNALPGAACCKLSSGKSVPTSAAQEPSQNTEEAIPASAISIVDVPSIPVQTGWTSPPVRPSGSALQAILCVFLI